MRTSDGRRSAQWEHTILVTDSGYEILTLREEEVAEGIARIGPPQIYVRNEKGWV